MKHPGGAFRKKDIAAILLLSAPVRLFFYFHLHVSIFGDTPTYIGARVNLFNGEIDPLRTPVYPWLLKAVAFLGPTRDFLHDVAIVQALLSFVSIVFFYNIACNALETRAAVLAATIIYAVSPTLIGFDWCILTESIAISGMVFFLFLLTNLLKSPSIAKAFLYTAFTFVLVMIRPAFLYLYGVMALFWLAKMFLANRHPQPATASRRLAVAPRKIAASGLLSLILCTLLTLGYKQLNNKVNGCNAISSVSNLNQLEAVAVYGLYPNGGDSLLTSIIDHDLHDTTHFFLATLQNSVQQNHIPPDRIDRYIKRSIASNPGNFVKKTIARFGSMQFEPIATIYAQETGQTGPAHFLLHLDPVNFLCVTGFLLVSGIFFLIASRKQKSIGQQRTIGQHKTIEALPALLWVIVAAHYAVVFLGAIHDHQRLFAPVLPLLILLVAYLIEGGRRYKEPAATQT